MASVALKPGINGLLSLGLEDVHMLLPLLLVNADLNSLILFALNLLDTLLLSYPLDLRRGGLFLPGGRLISFLHLFLLEN
jgi:hypothetical protein